jgi:PilZ domain
MENKRKEPRLAVMARAEVAWEDETRTPRTAGATIEDRSQSGACLRIGVPIIVGSKLTIKTHREQISGVVTNSRSDEKGYILGIKLDPVANSDPESPTSTVPIARSRE